MHQTHINERTIEDSLCIFVNGFEDIEQKFGAEIKSGVWDEACQFLIKITPFESIIFSDLGNSILLRAFDKSTDETIKQFFSQADKHIQTSINCTNLLIHLEYLFDTRGENDHCPSRQPCCKNASCANSIVINLTLETKRLANSSLYPEDKMPSVIDKMVKANAMNWHFQPIVDLKTNQSIGYESLLRTNMLEKKYILQAIKYAESHGLITDITKKNLIQVSRLSKEFDHKLRFSVNFSPKLFQNKDFNLLDFINRYWVENGADLNTLEIEITESAFADKMLLQRIAPHMESLINHGLLIAIDDFGVDYSTLSLLEQIPINIIKLDMTYVQRVIQSDYCTELISSTCRIAKTLNAKVQAEGVENKIVADKLQDLGVSFGQGFLYGMPTPYQLTPDILNQTLC